MVSFVEIVLTTHENNNKNAKVFSLEMISCWFKFVKRDEKAKTVWKSSNTSKTVRHKTEKKKTMKKKWIANDVHVIFELQN